MPGPLSNYRIVDLTTMISGPYATQLLADQGADVIKVESHAGDLMRWATPSRGGISAAFLLTNRSKRAIALDLKHHEGRAILNRLVATADVFVQNFRPGAIERMGFGEDQVRKHKSDIIYVSISGFGESGPYVHKRVYDPVIQALSGLMHMQGGDGTPRFVRTLVPDKLTAMTAAQAITTALLGRVHSGQGEHVRLSMLDATIAWLWPDGMLNDTLLGDGATAPLASGGNDAAYATRDGHIAMIIASDAEWAGFIRASGRAELADDARFKTLADRMAHLAELGDVMRDVVRNGTTAEWVAKFDEQQVPCAQVNSRQDLLSDPQVAHNRLIEETQHPHGGTVREPRPAARFGKHTVGAQRPAPMLGEHNDDILTELGITELARLRRQGVIT